MWYWGVFDNKSETVTFGAAVIWAFIVSDYVRSFSVRGYGNDDREAEALIAFGLWGLLLWWVSKRYGGGWSIYWFAFALASFAPFADAIDAAFGGVLGLRG